MSLLQTWTRGQLAELERSIRADRSGHGALKTYWHHRCRCADCRAASAVWSRLRRRRKTYRVP